MSDSLGSRGTGPETLPTTSLGHYKIRAKIGSGGMGDVYDAVHTGLNKRVAIKTLRKRYLDDEIVVARFLREGQLASRIRHPNIVDVTDVGMMGGLPCLVMEHLEGESFSAMIRREGRLPLDVIVDTLLPIIAAVDFAHDHGVVHRDLKPSNIFLARSWNGETVSKVLDFGISKLVHDADQAALTTDSAFVGTPHYASPELMRADRLADGRSDQYSLGVILYEAATGVRPFADLGNNFVALAMAICKGEFPSARARNAAIPATFERVITRAMSLQPQDRFLTMRALGEALLPFASERARMIWAPTFRGQSGAVSAASAAPSEPHSTTMQVAGPGDGSSGSGSGRVSAPPGTPRFGVASASHSSQPSHPSHPSHASHPSQAGHATHPSGPPTPMGQPFAASAGLISQPMSAGGAMSSGPFDLGPRSVPPHSVPPHSQGPYPTHPSGTPPGAAFDRLPSYGAGTSVPPLAQRGARSSGLLTGIIGVALGVAIVVTVVVVRSGRRSEGDVASGKTTQVDPLYAIDIQVTPATASIEMDGSPAGAGRLARSLPRDGKKHALRLAAPGYESLLIEFDETHPPPNVIGLRATVAAANGAGNGATTPPVTSNAGATASPGAAGGHGKGVTTGGKVKDRPKTDNIDPWE